MYNNYLDPRNTNFVASNSTMDKLLDKPVEYLKGNERELKRTKEKRELKIMKIDRRKDSTESFHSSFIFFPFLLQWKKAPLCISTCGQKIFRPRSGIAILDQMTGPSANCERLFGEKWGLIFSVFPLAKAG